MSDKIRFVGIDFGTSTTVMSCMDYEYKGGVLTPSHNLQNVPANYNSIPTVIKLADDKLPEQFGNQVQEASFRSDPSLIKTEFKMRLDSAIKQEKLEARDLTAKFFQYLFKVYHEFEETLAHDIKEHRIYVSYPAKWNTEQKSITIDAAYEAFKALPDVQSVYSIDEPTAVLFHCLRSKDVDKKAKEELLIEKSSFILLIDMGAGTTDLVLYEYIPGKPARVIAKYPEPGKDSFTFGGREVDFLLKRHFEDEFPHRDLMEGSEVQLLNYSKTWKETISDYLSKIDNEFKEPPRFVYTSTIRGYNRNRICWILREYLPTFPLMVNKIIELGSSNYPQFAENNGDIDFIILTGGHSQWFFIEEMLKGKWVPGLPGNENLGSGINLPKLKAETWRLIKSPYPQHVVSWGLCSAGIPIPVIQLSNCDVWLEIELGNSASQKEKIISRNVRLPVKKTFSKRFNCRIGSETFNIPVVLTPRLGVKGDECLDPIKIEVPTNDWRDLLTQFSDRNYRDEKLDLELTCRFDENQIFSFHGKATTPGFWGYEKNISMSSREIAQRIRNIK